MDRVIAVRVEPTQPDLVTLQQIPLPIVARKRELHRLSRTSVDADSCTSQVLALIRQVPNLAIDVVEQHVHGSGRGSDAADSDARARTNVADFLSSRASRAILQISAAGETAGRESIVSDFSSSCRSSADGRKAQNNAAPGWDGLCEGGGRGNSGACVEVARVGGLDAEQGKGNTDAASSVGLVEDEHDAVAILQVALVKIIVASEALHKLCRLAERVLVDCDKITVGKNAQRLVGHVRDVCTDHKRRLESSPDGEMGSLLGDSHTRVAHFEQVHVGEFARP